MLPNFTHSHPTSLPDAIRQLTSRKAVIHAGGTDLLGCLRDRVFEADTLVSIAGLKELRGIRVLLGGGLRIGTLTSLTEIARSAVIAERYPGLTQAAGAAASPQLRNQGTIGGNLCQRPRCWYFRGDFQCLRKGGEKCYAIEGENEFHAIFGGSRCFIVHPSDTAPALMAFNARLRIASASGTKIVPLESFFLLPIQDITRENVLHKGEIITDVLLPAPVPGMRSSYRKVRARGAWDFALAGVALALTFSGREVSTAAIVLSGVAPVPWRATHAERALIGQRLDTQTASRVAEAAVKGAEPMSQNGYKVDLVRGVFEEALLAFA